LLSGRNENGYAVRRFLRFTSAWCDHPRLKFFFLTVLLQEGVCIPRNRLGDAW